MMVTYTGKKPTFEVFLLDSAVEVGGGGGGSSDADSGCEVGWLCQGVPTKAFQERSPEFYQVSCSQYLHKSWNYAYKLLKKAP